MTHQELQAVGDAFVEASIVAALAAINARAAGRRIVDAEFDAVAFTGPHSSRQAGTLGLLGDQSVRQQLIAAGIVS